MKVSTVPIYLAEAEMLDQSFNRINMSQTGLLDESFNSTNIFGSDWTA